MYIFIRTYEGYMFDKHHRIYNHTLSFKICSNLKVRSENDYTNIRYLHVFRYETKQHTECE